MNSNFNKFGNKKVKEFDRTWDSKMELSYYRYLLYLKEQGEVLAIELQPTFLLQESYKYKGKTIRKLEYKSDFRVKYKDGSEVIIDVKGMCAKEFLIKLKLVRYKYNDLDFRCVKAIGTKYFDVPVHTKWKELDM